MQSLKLPWPPTVNTYYRHTLRKGKAGGAGPLVYLSEKGRKYKDDAQWDLLSQNAPKGLVGGVEVQIEAYPPDRRKRDLDNILKPLLDSLEEYGVFESGDDQIDILSIRRRQKGGYVIVHVSEIDSEWRLTG